MKKYVIRTVLFILRMFLVIGIGILLYRFGNFAYDFGHQIYCAEGMAQSPGMDMAVTISDGQSISDIADMLERFGLIKDSKVFIVQERLSKYHGQIKAGNYVLNTSMSGNQMIDILTGHPEEESEET